MHNVILSTRNIDDLISDIANEVVKKVEFLNSNSQQICDNSDKFLTIQEAASFLRLTVPTIYSKVSKGELPVMKQGKRLYFSQAELLEYIKEGKKKSNSEIEAEAEAYLKEKGGAK